MSTAEYIFVIIGFVIMIGGFVYGIYDSYFQKKDSSSTTPKSDSDPKTP